MHLPGEPAVPAAQPFARELIIPYVGRMKDHRQGSQSQGGNALWKRVETHAAVTVLLHTVKPGTHLLHGCHVREATRGVSDRMPGVINDLVFQRFRGRNAVHSVDETAHALSRLRLNFPQGTSGGGFDGRHAVVHVARYPL